MSIHHFDDKSADGHAISNTSWYWQYVLICQSKRYCLHVCCCLYFYFYFVLHCFSRMSTHPAFVKGCMILERITSIIAIIVPCGLMNLVLVNQLSPRVIQNSFTWTMPA